MGSTVGILGASGYSGAELLRLLLDHPGFTVTAVAAGRRAGDELSAVHPHLPATGLELGSAADVATAGVDVLFSCLPSGELESLGPIRAGTVVDLSDEHRGDEEWTYGLTEFVRGSLPAPRVANPGCYPTAALLSLVPFARAGAIEAPVIVDAMSGVSGAGRKAEDRFLFANLSGDVTAYGDAFHRHVPEIERGLAVLGGLEATVSFTPHLIPIPRGLVTTARARLRYPLDDAGAVAVLRDAYEGERFVRVIEQWPAAKSVAGSNGAVVSARVDRRGGWLIASAAIDNLGKGASGQALQNANLCLGFDETAGLSAAGVWP